MPSPLCHARRAVSLLPTDLLKTKGVSSLQKLDTCSSLGQSHKASLLPKVFFSPLGSLLLLFGFLPQRVKGRTADSAGAKGGIRDSTGELQSSLQKMLYFKALSVANPSSFPVSIKLEGRSKLFLTAEINRTPQKRGTR